MALANIAVLLTQWGYKTLVIDWDLEAPGLENFYSNQIDREQVIKKQGLIDLLNLKTANTDISAEKINWDEYISHIHIDKGNVLDIITAGKRDEDYVKKVKQFDFNSFYQNADGGQFLEDLREYWLDTYNFVLIDSRTGLTDSSGICSIHMPDILVLLFTPNEQSFTGIKTIAKKATAGQKQIIYDRFKLRTLPIPSRIEFQETSLLDEWMTRIYSESDEMLEWLPKKANKLEETVISPAQLLNLLKIPYRTFYAYGEKLAVKERGTHDPQDLGYAYETIAAVLANDFQDIDLLTDARDSYVKKAKGEDYTDESKFKNRIEKEQEAKRELENIIEDKEALARKKSKISRIIIAVLFLIIIAFALVLTFTKKDNISYVEQEKSDSLLYKDLYLSFKASYLNLDDTSRFSLGPNIELLKNYYQLDSTYKDSVKDIKSGIDEIIKNESVLFLKNYYMSLQSKGSSPGVYFDDTVIQYGSLQNINPVYINSLVDEIKKSAKIKNDFADKTDITYKTDSAGIYLSYLEKGNFLIDSKQEYADMICAVSVNISFNFKIRSLTYTLIKGSAVSATTKKIVVEIFLCAAKDKMQAINASDVVKALEKTKRFNVISRNNFSIPADTSSPYFITSNQIRFNGADELQVAREIQKIILNISAIKTDIKEARTPTPNYLSVFICFGNMQNNLRSKY